MPTDASRSGAISGTPFPYNRRLWHNSACLLAGDIAGLTAALLLGGVMRLYLIGGSSMVPPWSWMIIPVWIVGAYFMELLPDWGIGPVEHLRRLVTLVITAFGLAAAALFLSKTGAEESRFTITIAFLLALMLVPVLRSQIKSMLVKRQSWGMPTVIYGSDNTSAHVLETLRHEAGLGYIPIGIFDDESAPGSYINGIPVLGNLEEHTLEAPFAIIATTQTTRQRLSRLLEGPLTVYRRVVVIPDLQDAPSLWVTPRDFLGLVGIEIAVNLMNPVSRFLKRASDILLVLLTAPFWIPLCLVVGLLIFLDDRHSPLFHQDRTGFSERNFRTLKFRTMRTDAEEYLKETFANNPDLEQEWLNGFKLKMDPRITRVGHFLRKTSLDELPQLINVLRGDMSLVGPRPLPDYHFKQLPASIRALRSRVRPGITGLWQVSGRSESGTEGMERWDAYYVRNWSIWLDIVILVRTLRAVTSGRGAY